MKAKRVISFFCAVLMLASLLALPALAAEPEQQVIDLGDGYYVIRTIETHVMARSGDTVSGSVSESLYYQGTKVGSATLAAVFDISGSSAVALGAALQGSGMNGWTYTDGGTYCGGNRATGTAIFSSGSVVKQLPLSLSCTPDGELY